MWYDTVSRREEKGEYPMGMTAVISVMAGGALGCGLRYWVSQALVRPDQFPMGTLTVNLVGCFLIGVMATWFGQLADLSEGIRLAVIVGFLGGFTTFSSFGLDTVRLLEDGRIAAATTYVLMSNVIGILAVWGGIKAVRSVTG